MLLNSFGSKCYNASVASQPGRCRLVSGGFVRLIRPVSILRVSALLLGLAVCLPPTADAATQTTTRKKTTTRTASATQKASTAPAQSQTTTTSSAARTPAYSASASQARKARLARARAAARTREISRMRAVQEVMTPRYKTDVNGELVPDVRAAAAIIFNPANGQVLWQENAQDKRSIASITKVMTTVVFLEDNPDLTQDVTVERSDVYAASTTYLKANDRLPLGEVLHLVLIASDNAGARVLARVSHQAGVEAVFVSPVDRGGELDRVVAPGKHDAAGA